MPVLTREQTVDIGHGRGRLSPAAAASLRRVDAALGRPADVNSAWRDPVLQDQMNRAWIAWQNGTGPRPNHGRALPSKDSIHCRGDAIDTDDAPGYKPELRDEWEDNGWRFEVRDEKWHGEYRSWLDKNIGQTAGGGNSALPGHPNTISIEEDDMLVIKITKTSKDGRFKKDQCFANTFGQPITLLGQDEVDALEFNASKYGILYRKAEWSGDDLARVVKYRGFRPTTGSVGTSDYTRVQY